MRAHLKVVTDVNRETLLRIVGLVERRGYAIEGLECRRHEGRMDLHIEVDPADRPVDRLVRHLEKLVCVRRVELQQAAGDTGRTVS